MLQLTCVCGWTAQGDEDELYELTVEHGKEIHNMEVTRQQMLEMCRAI